LSSILIHGPGAKTRAEEEAHSWGRLAGRFGDDGLKIDDARQVVVLVHQPPVYPDEKLPIILIGPMDTAMPKTQDVLLKSVEDSKEVGLVLWTKDAGMVRKTIRSRCLTYWAPVSEFVVPELHEEAESLLKHLDAGRIADAIQVVVDQKDKIDDLLEAVSFGVARNWDLYGEFWLRLRKGIKYWNPTMMGVIAAMVSE